MQRRPRGVCQGDSTLVSTVYRAIHEDIGFELPDGSHPRRLWQHLNGTRNRSITIKGIVHEQKTHR